MSKNQILMRIKRYCVYSGWLMLIVGLIGYFSSVQGVLEPKVIGICFISVLYGYMAGLIIDCFITEAV